MELPVVSRRVSKVSKNNSTNLMVENTIMESTIVKSSTVKITERSIIKNNSINTNNDDEKFQSFDYLSSDSGCVSLNSTNENDYSLLDEQKSTENQNIHNSLESLSSCNDSTTNDSYDSNDSNESVLMLIQTEQQEQKNELKKQKITTHTINLTIDNRLIRSSYNLTKNLNDGHVLIGFRINDKFFSKVFEQNWQEMSGARYFSHLVAAKFGLRRLKFLKRIALNTERQGEEFDDGTTFVFLLHAEFLNLTNENEIYLSNFVHRLRMRTLGSVTFYTNLSIN